MENMTFYKKRLVADEDGLTVVTDKLVSIHETKCFHFCIPDFEHRIIGAMKTREETPLQYAKRRKILKRISKTYSRIAFDTEDAALANLKFLKKRQLQHLRRDIAFNEKFLSTDALEHQGSLSIVPGSRDLVHEHFCFD